MVELSTVRISSFFVENNLSSATNCAPPYFGSSFCMLSDSGFRS